VFHATCTAISTEDVNGQLTRTLEPHLIESNDWHSDYVLRFEVSEWSISQLVVTISIQCDEAWYLSSNRSLLALTGRVVPPFPVGRFVVVKTRHGFFKYDFPWPSGFELYKLKSGIEIKAAIQNKQKCGLSLWSSQGFSELPQKFALPVSRDRLSSPFECLWLEPYPRGARAAICLTDHADFDSVDKLELLVDLFIKNNFRFTKTVFPQSEPIKGKAEPGMDVRQYANLIERLYEQGSEIAYHGFGPRVQAPSMEECVRRAEVMRRFQATTWTDHGTGSYLFSRGGTLKDGTKLTEFLKPFGVINYWSYTDIWNNPFRNLKCWQTRGVASIPGDMLVGFSSAQTLGGASYLLMHAFSNILGEQGREALRVAPLQKRNWMKALSSHKQIQSLITSPVVIYGQDGSGFSLNIEGVWIFDTILLNHLAIQLEPRLIDRLYEESGLLVAHCYLGATHKYIFGNCFIDSQPGLSLEPSFVRNIEYLAERQRRGDVVSLSFAQLRECLVSFVKTSLVRHEYGWLARTDAGRSQLVIAGECSVIAAAVCEHSDKYFSNHIGYITLPSDQEVNIKIGTSSS
jgi:hypothetical protein